MKEHPILFNGEMVRAILEGRKTQTRRVVNPPPPEHLPDSDIRGPEVFSPYIIRNGEQVEGEPIYGVYDDWGEWGAKFPYGQPGDRLWVRETWSPDHKDFYPFDKMVYRADNCHAGLKQWAKDCELHNHYPNEGCACHFRWRPSIHMKRENSRIDLEITDVRVERLQDISEEDAKAEGFGNDEDPFWRPTACDPDSGGYPSCRNSFHYVWDSIYKNWGTNPWVFVIEFKRIK